ncbi:MAG: hypothetical protein A3J79_03155 [Elusimicrobia bacterium RIFOXYB2_FULL_62_6]|nr:MAG: hypothetical protein A3J79_03155 [Elusimicrobia bacterium RIFOXYB2_FULL_62_6]
MPESVINILWSVVFSLVGGMAGVFLLILLSSRIPKVFDKLTPNVDEGKEIVRGNRAVAEYFGRIVSSGIIGVSIIIAAAVLGGILAALHGGTPVLP